MSEDETVAQDVKNNGDLPIFVKWMDYLKWLLVTVEKFPKKARFTFADRLVNLALEMVDDLVEARYAKHKVLILQRSNLRMERIRILMRISYELRFVSHDSYKHSAKLLTEIGKMLGGWVKQQSGRGPEVKK